MTLLWKTEIGSFFAAAEPGATESTVSVETALLLLVLALLVFVASRLSALNRRLEQLERPLATAVISAAESAPAGRANPTCPAPEVLAAISAAVHMAVGRGSRIVSLRACTPDQQAWSQEGRREVYRSHRLR